jgi:AcrR family transcriptional regulator
MATHEGKRSDSTRRALLRAAREEFAEQGLAGARVDGIAEAAGVNKERIYGIFGSKDKLFDAVLIDVMQEFTEVVDPLWKTGDIGGFVGDLYDYQRLHPQLLRLLTWEALHRGDDAHDVGGWRREHYRQKLEGALRHFGTDDPFRAGLMTLVVCGIPNWLNLVPQLRRLMLGERADDAAAIKAFLVRFAEGAARAAGAGTEPVNTLTEETAGTAGETAAAASDAAPAAGPDAPGVRTEDDPVAAAAARLRRAQAEAEAAKADLGRALREANTAGASANGLAKRVAGTVSRPVVLKLLAE